MTGGVSIIALCRLNLRWLAALSTKACCMRAPISDLQSQPSAPNTFTDALTWLASAE